MYCVGCGKEITQGVNFCSACGTVAPSPVQPSAPFAHGASPVRINAPIWLFCVIGGVLGGIIGYLTRPSAIFVGQLPFGTVITGGAGLQGLDQLLLPVAQQSLNQMLTWTIIGAVLGGVACAILRRMKPTS
jgi:hypothetical protein